jgi:hypothetical protein
LGSDIAVLDVLEQPAEAFADFEELGVRARYYQYAVPVAAIALIGAEQVVLEQASQILKS